MTDTRNLLGAKMPSKKLGVFASGLDFVFTVFKKLVGVVVIAAAVASLVTLGVIAIFYMIAH